eukprot:Cvel_31036.t1-p1 / transcript=Cvel_31036.t1 / gene=Cvel_31036 / organism=Chromera_velia_CCMP2878 / gene_product=hypothetical protein / transcript_product=hypothetical protein / location=Cvel_scaffold4544:7629-8807(+) / protein_length=222 / sequence_SO=supercontig / SO=protein_coding / is_pseudo=false
MEVGADQTFFGDGNSYVKTFVRLSGENFPFSLDMSANLVLEPNSGLESEVNFDFDSSFDWFGSDVREAVMQSCRRTRERDTIMLHISPMCLFLNRIAIAPKAPEERTAAEGGGEEEKGLYTQEEEVRDLHTQLLEWLQSPFGRAFASQFIFWPRKSEEDPPRLRVFRSTVLTRPVATRSLAQHRMFEPVRRDASSSEFFAARITGFGIAWPDTVDTLLSNLK